MATIDVSGLDVVQEAMRKLTGGEFRRRVREGTYMVGKELENVMKVYPPKPAHSTYVRQHHLEQAWNTQRTNNGAVVANSQTYARWVQSAKDQVWFHKLTGWTTDEQGVKRIEDMDIISNLMEKALMAGV